MENLNDTENQKQINHIHYSKIKNSIFLTSQPTNDYFITLARKLQGVAENMTFQILKKFNLNFKNQNL